MSDDPNGIYLGGTRDELHARIRKLEAENKALREGRGVVLETLPPECAPKECPLLVAGGIAMKKTGGQWFTGMEEPAFERPITWEVKWWAPIPQQNDLSAISPVPVSVPEAALEPVDRALRHIEGCLTFPVSTEINARGYDTRTPTPETVEYMVELVVEARAALAETEGE